MKAIGFIILLLATPALAERSIEERVSSYACAYLVNQIEGDQNTQMALGMVLCPEILRVAQFAVSSDGDQREQFQNLANEAASYSEKGAWLRSGEALKTMKAKGMTGALEAQQFMSSLQVQLVQIKLIVKTLNDSLPGK